MDTNVLETNQLYSPASLQERLPIDHETLLFVKESRRTISDIINGKDDRLLCIIGPCSIHNTSEAKSYALKLRFLMEKYVDKLYIVMRTYFEKPRTTVGWKGLINDPYLDNTYSINDGLYYARELLIFLNQHKIPCAYEILDSITPQYISELIAWGAIGARTVESQTHRELVSGLSMPIGFKNSTDGNIKVATDAVLSASFPHCFLGITYDGKGAIVKTKGNHECHIILRGSTKTPNYYISDIEKTIQIINTYQETIKPNIMIDCSHGNSQKDHNNQEKVIDYLIKNVFHTYKQVIGIMIESNINEGRQNISESLKYGVSVTDSCISIEKTGEILDRLYNSL